MSSSLKDIYKYINRFNLPVELEQYYVRKTGTGFDLNKDLYKLKSLLLSYGAKRSEEETDTYIFLIIVGYFLGEKKLALYFISKIEHKPLDLNLMRLIMEIKYSIRWLDKTLILTSVTATKLSSLDKIAKYVNAQKTTKFRKNQLDILRIKDLKYKELRSKFKLYEQVFLVGHGDSKRLELGDRKIILKDIVQLIEGKLDKPNVLGIFSCENAFRCPEVWNNVDYFITDNGSSVPDYIEMFLNGYLRSFYNNFEIYKAFDSGRILPILRAVADPTYELFEKGHPVRP